MRRILLLWLLAFGFVLSLSARPVDKNTAQKVAKNFYSERMSSDNYPGISSVNLVMFKGVDSYYVFNMKKQKGFILIAANDASIPVLAYSFHGSYSNTNQPENFAKTIEQYNLQLEYLKKNQIKATLDITRQWKKYLKADNTKGGSIQSIAPLLTTVWAQGCFYNDSTPVDASGPCGHPVTGCVATAMAQVMNYYEFPYSGSGSHSYNSNYGMIGANFDSTIYNWSVMPDTLNSQSSSASVAQVAQLMSHCGIAVEMMYSAGGSGAFSQDATNAFAHYFNYDNGLQLLHRANFSDTVWEKMVRAELDSLRPLYYDGSGSGGHAFVCDGYQSSNYFHFNWGWSGSHNGYYLLSALNPGGMNFSNYCGAVFGMKPGVPQSCNGITDTLTAKAGNISDGSYGQDYQNNTTCSWLISPAGAVSVSLEFFTFDLQSNDSLFVYDGSNTSATLLGAFSGNSLPASLASSAGQMFVQFVTDNQNTASGWSAYYRSEYCDGLVVLNNLTGSLTDGSGLENYNDYTNCYWLISNNMNQNIHLDFTSFDTELNFDYVDVYDGSSTTANQLGSFSGNQLPQSLTSTGGMMLIHFHSDGGVTDQGWAANYYSCIKPDAPYVSDSVEFCSGDSVLLIIPAYADSFLWQKNGLAQPNITSKQWAVKQSGTYSFIYYSNQCPNEVSDSVWVFENFLPNINLGNDTVLCDNLSLLLDGGSGYSSYLWSTGDTTQSIIVSSSTGNSQNISLIVSNNKSCSNSDIIHVQFVDCTGIEENSISVFKLFPNPAEEHIQLEFASVVDHIVIRIIDLQGQIIMVKEASYVESLRINTSELASGMYYLEVENSGKRTQKKFLKK